MNTNDPFEKAKAIRKGELDNEMPSYDELSGWLQRVPKTWLPALLCNVTHLCAVQGVFQEGGIERAVASAIEKSKKPIGLR